MATAKTAIIGIDPGSSSGAMCLYTDFEAGQNPHVEAFNMPADYETIYLCLSALSQVYGANLFAVIENVGGTRPGNAAKAARTFSEHMGALKMALIACGIKSVTVAPRKWMVATCGYDVPTGSSPEQKKERKEYIYEKMQFLYPDVKITKRQADAVALMHYGRSLNREDGGLL